MRRPRNALALSGGGAYGAYTAGFVAGWTGSGTRPEFDVVTGISTGALIAPLAFLGPDYDCKLRNLYTRVQASDIFKVRAWVTIPFTDAATTSAPLKKLIEAEITPEMMDRVATEHRKGRRLYVGTTNLDTRRLVVWDMGAIACRGCPAGCALFRDVLLASCSVPGMFPPVRFEVEVDGRKATELHVDGGVTAQLFVPSPVFAAAARGVIEDAGRPGPPPGVDPMPAGGNLYVVVAGKLFPDANPVRPRVLPVLGASANSVIYAHCRADLANLYGLSRAAGLRYHLASLRQDFPTLDTSVDFDPKAMNELYAEGVSQGTNGQAWAYGPPTLSPGDGDFIRTGLKLRTPPIGLPGPGPDGN
jgi:predicted acylesterase/phospholipase RssA